MDLATINVILNNNSEYVFHPGDTIEGTLEIEIPRPTKLKGIYIKFKGTGHVRFYHPVPINRHGRTRDVLFHADEDYIKQKVYCLKNTGDAINLAKGKHVYPFSYHMPFTLPSTYEHDLGATIQYSFKAVLEHPKRVKQEEIRQFLVVSPLDLSLYPALRVSATTCLEKKQTFLWYEATKMKINVKIPRSGYAMGETISIYTEVHNTSNKDIPDICFDLQKITKFNANTPKKETKKVFESLAKINLGIQPARSLQTFNNDMIIPIVGYHNVNGSKLINITYELQVACNRGGHHAKITGKIPITIGSWPPVQPFQYADAPVE